MLEVRRAEPALRKGEAPADRRGGGGSACLTAMGTSIPAPRSILHTFDIRGAICLKPLIKRIRPLPPGASVQHQ